MAWVARALERATVRHQKQGERCRGEPKAASTKPEDLYRMILLVREEAASEDSVNQVHRETCTGEVGPPGLTPYTRV